MENVENLVSHNKGETLRRIVTTLEDELGYRIIGVTMDEDGSYVYNTKSFIRNSKNFGLPQNRPRTYIMAFSKKMFGDAVKVLTDDMPFSNHKVISEDLNSIIEPEVDDVYYMSSGYWDTLKKHKMKHLVFQKTQLEPRNINNLVIQLQFLLLKKWPFLCCHVLKK